MQTDQPKDDGSTRPEFDLLTCPWCGGPADIEEIGGKDGAGASFSVGCHDGDGKAVCFGYQSLTSFARKSDAVLAWNTRSPAHPAARAPDNGNQMNLIDRASDNQANLIADSLIDYIRAPYSRSWLLERIYSVLSRAAEGK